MVQKDKEILKILSLELLNGSKNVVLLNNYMMENVLDAKKLQL